MSTCKWCDAVIFWDKIPTSRDCDWRPFDDEDCEKPHRCELYKPKSEGKKAVEAEAKRQREEVMK